VAVEHAFASDRDFGIHYYNHVVIQREFGGISRETYARMATRFMLGPSDNFTIEKVRRQSGRVLRYSEATGEFGVATVDGVVITYYRFDPAVHGFSSNMEYFE
jgi:hypothetical protein